MFPLGALLATRNINTSTQVQSTEAYNSAVAMAELGIPRAEAELQLALENNEAKIDRILEEYNDPDDIIFRIGSLIATETQANIDSNNINFEEDKLSTTINISLHDEKTTANQMVFNVESIGQSSLDYGITAVIIVPTSITIAAPESGDNSQPGDFHDPWDFIDHWALDREIRSEVVFPTLNNTHPGGAFSGDHHFNSTSFSDGVTISEESRFFVDGHMHGSGLTVNGASEFNVSQTLRIENRVSMTDVSKATIGSHVEFAGGPNLTRSTLHVGGTLISSGSSTIDDSTLWVKGSYALHDSLNINNGSNFIVESDMSKTNGITIRNSTAIFNGRSAFNTLDIVDSGDANNPGVETKNLRVGKLTLNNSQMLANGSVRSGWGTNIGLNSELNVRGHLLTEDQITLGDNATLQVSGDLTAGGQKSMGSNSHLAVYGNFSGKETHVGSNSEATINGNMLAGGQLTLRDHATLLVGGNLRANNQKSIGANATLTVYGDLEFPNPDWNSISFNGNGSRIMIYGEAINAEAFINSANIKYVEREAECPAETNSNIVCFINENPPSLPELPDPIDPSLPEQEPEFEWDSEFKLQDINYSGLKH